MHKDDWKFMIKEKLIQNIEIWEGVDKAGNMDWHRDTINCICEAIPKLTPGEAMAIYRLGYLNGFDRAEEALDKTRALFS